MSSDLFKLVIELASIIALRVSRIKTPYYFVNFIHANGFCFAEVNRLIVNSNARFPPMTSSGLIVPLHVM